MGHYAERVNGMPKYVASRTLAGPLGVERHPHRG
jgi:hypothetical protein